MEQKAGLTVRAIGIAAAATFLIAWWVQRVEFVYDGPKLVTHVPPTAPMMVLTLLLLVGALGRRVRLSRSEMVLIYGMLMVSAPLASLGLVHRFLPGLTTGLYGGFAEETGTYFKFLKHIPRWAVPGWIGSEAVVGSFEGSERGVPWGAWMVPLTLWSLFFLAVFFSLLCLVTLLRKQWVEHERLRFPLVELPLAVIPEKDGEASAWMAFFRNKLVWIGFAVPGVLFTVNGLHHYVPRIGPIRVVLDFSELLLEAPWNVMAHFEAPFRFYFSPMLVGIAYLLAVEITFSTWFFFLVTRLQLLVSELFGQIEHQGSTLAFGLEWPAFVPFPFAQARGGLICMVLLGLWTARKHLKDVVRKALGRAPEIDDSDEPLSYRTAVFGLLGGGLFLVLWAHLFGLSLHLSLIYFLLFFLFTIGMSRLRIDAGIPVLTVPIMAHLFYIVWGGGPDVFTRDDYVTFAYMNVLGYTGLGALMMVQFESFRMSDVVGLSRRKMSLAMFLALLLGLFAAYYFCLKVIYQHGLFVLDHEGGALSEARIGRYYQYSYQQVGDSPSPTDWVRIAFHGIGFAVTYVLTVMRRLFLRWPFHPLGYIFGIGMGKILWGSMLVGWAAKSIVVRYGGATIYRRVRPFFFGMIFGELAMRAFWAIVSLFGDMGGGYPVWDTGGNVL